MAQQPHLWEDREVLQAAFSCRQARHHLLSTLLQLPQPPRKPIFPSQPRDTSYIRPTLWEVTLASRPSLQQPQGTLTGKDWKRLMANCSLQREARPGQG